jgi:dUTP pyrophosphatase
MHIVKIHKGIKTPLRGTEGAAGYDIFMPEDGKAFSNHAVEVPLGFKLAIPEGFVALIFPRSGVGVKNGLELNNTCGVIDADYRGEWKAFIKLKNQEELHWHAGDRILQFVVIPCLQAEIQEVDELPQTNRGTEGFGTTGK